MAKIISFEGPIGAGKTTLVNYFSSQLKLKKILEHSQQNPFIDKFYTGDDVKLETELTFLLLHYSLLKNSLALKDEIILTDFSIEKDLVFARMNLNRDEFKLFKQCYDYVNENIRKPELVIYLDLPFNILRQRIIKRERPYEMNVDPNYFKKFNDEVKGYFQKESKSNVYYYEVDDLELNRDNKKLSIISELIHGLFS
jgi:deoxyguanosine kinase